MLQRFRNWVTRFMYGRYGADQLGQFMIWTALALLVISMLTRSSILNTLSLVLLILCYVRMLSKKRGKRYAENEKFLELKSRVTGFFRSGGRSLRDREHCYFRCPNCRQKVRVPRGKGHIEIRCPKCNTRFIKRT